MAQMKQLIRRCVPEPVIRAYHWLFAVGAAVWYGHPSRELIVIGVTGTNGKSSTVMNLGRILEHAGYRVGWTTTVNFKVAEREWVNDQKMTMLGRFATQRLLREMVRAGCTHAIIETSSQGIAQSRHVGVDYDVAVFTNLTPEHLDSHGSFEAYREAKGKLFAAVARRRAKTVNGMEIPTITIVNAMDEHAAYFFSFGASRRYGFGIDGKAIGEGVLRESFTPVMASSVDLTAACTTFAIGETEMHLKPIGTFQLMNALAAATTAHALGLTWEHVARGVCELKSIPGRLESIMLGQPFQCIVDYAYEPYALKALYEAMKYIPYTRLIQVIGSAGGGRDVWRREELGRVSAQQADVVIVTNEDPYDDDPQVIVDAVADGARGEGVVEGETLFRILDRQEAINTAVAIAQPGDLVLVTGKGSEPVMAVANGRKIPWDDREAVRAALRTNGYNG